VHVQARRRPGPRHWMYVRYGIEYKCFHQSERADPNEGMEMHPVQFGSSCHHHHSHTDSTNHRTSVSPGDVALTLSVPHITWRSR
jgi:hypothetical protein